MEVVIGSRLDAGCVEASVYDELGPGNEGSGLLACEEE